MGLWNFHQPVKELKSAGKIFIKWPYDFASEVRYTVNVRKFESVKKCHPCDFASDTPMVITVFQALHCKIVLLFSQSQVIRIFLNKTFPLVSVMDKVNIRFLEYLQRIIVPRIPRFRHQHLYPRQENVLKYCLAWQSQLVEDWWLCTHVERQGTSHRRNPPGSAGHTCSSPCLPARDLWWR